MEARTLAEADTRLSSGSSYTWYFFKFVSYYLLLLSVDFVGLIARRMTFAGGSRACM